MKDYGNLYEYEVKTILNSLDANTSGQRFSKSFPQKCSCYQDMLNSYIILVDYKFNEKFINGARLRFDHLFQMPMVTYAPYITKNDPKSSSLTSISVDDELKRRLAKPATFLTAHSNKEHQISRWSLHQNNEITNRFMYLLIVKSCNIFLTLLNNRSAKDTRQKFYKSMRDDYRLRNFFCLYSLIESDLDDAEASSANDLGHFWLAFNHLKSSVISFRNFLKNFVSDFMQGKLM